jgi:hypothetical protein
MKNVQPTNVNRVKQNLPTSSPYSESQLKKQVKKYCTTWPVILSYQGTCHRQIISVLKLQ